MQDVAADQEGREGTHRGGEVSATTKCKMCGKSIVFATIEKADGTAGHIPLDMVAACYRLVKDTDTGEEVGVRDKFAYVSHFQTCPQASSHSRTKKAKANG